MAYNTLLLDKHFSMLSRNYIKYLISSINYLYSIQINQQNIQNDEIRCILINFDLYLDEGIFLFPDKILHSKLVNSLNNQYLHRVRYALMLYMMITFYSWVLNILQVSKQYEELKKKPNIFGNKSTSFDFDQQIIFDFYVANKMNWMFNILNLNKIGSFSVQLQQLKNLNQNMKKSRIELLQWVNAMVQAQYTTIQMLGDTIAYCQILQAIHPNAINIYRLNLNTKYPEDCIRNTKILEDGLKKLKITQPASMEKIGKGKFQDNIIFAQWLYNYGNKYGEEALQSYNGYQKRLQILQRQGKYPQDMSSHLVPNQMYMQYEGYHQQEFQMNQSNIEEHNEQQNRDKQIQIKSKISQINQYIVSLEDDLRQKMQKNWRIMTLIDRSIEERNIVYSLLQQIQKITRQQPENLTSKEILFII